MRAGCVKPRVFHTPKAIPTNIHTAPIFMAGRLRFSHSNRQMMNPKTGGIKFQTFFSSARQVVTKEGCGVHAHEGDEGAEVKHIEPQVVGGGGGERGVSRKEPDERHRADEQNVVARHVMLGVDAAEEGLG